VVTNSMAETGFELVKPKSVGGKLEELSKSRPHQPAVTIDDDDVVEEQVAGGLAGFLQSDAFQRIILTVNAAISVYAATMAALLGILVPQLCCPVVSCIICILAYGYIIFLCILWRCRFLNL
jgi:hypothetical protein